MLFVTANPVSVLKSTLLFRVFKNENSYSIIGWYICTQLKVPVPNLFNVSFPVVGKKDKNEYIVDKKFQQISYDRVCFFKF